MIARVLEIEANRRAIKWTLREQAGRTLWALVSPLFRFSPRFLWGWRRVLLRSFGSQVGSKAHIYPTVRITIPWNLSIGEEAAVGDHAILYALGPIEIGPRATVSQYVHLCAGTHDWRDPAMPLIKTPIVICADAWICSNAFIGPGVTVGERAIVGAAAVAVKDIKPEAIVGGNPARTINARDK